MSTYLVNYISGIRNGDYIVGNELRLMLEGLFADMYCDKYVYDTKDAEKRIQFIERAVEEAKEEEKEKEPEEKKSSKGRKKNEG